jgi:hypothetical protein
LLVPAVLLLFGCSDTEGSHFTVASQSGWTPFGRGCKLLIPLCGEMSEWLKEHAWKAKPGSNTEEPRGIVSDIHSMN